MFRPASVLRGISPFSLFMMDQRHHPLLVGLPIVKRAKMLSEMYKTLPKSKRENLEKRAMKHSSFTHHKLQRMNFTAYSAKYASAVQALHPSKRKAALSRMYALKKRVVIQGSKGRKKIIYPCNGVEKAVKSKLKRFEHKEKPEKKVGDTKAKKRTATKKKFRKTGSGSGLRKKKR